MNWTIERVTGLDGYAVEWAEEANFYLSRRHELFRTDDLAKKPFERLAVVDAPSWKRAAARFRPAQRLLRFMVTNVVPLAGGEVFVTFDKSVGIVRDGKYRALDGLERPCRVLRGACAVDRHGNVFFGEYLDNRERGEMRIYKYEIGADRLRVVHTFPAGTIRHVHGIYFDEYNGSLVCLTGDDERECRLTRTFDEFATLEMIGAGDESWRAVSVLFSEDALFYGTDAEYRANCIYRLDRRSGARDMLGEVSGTVFYAKKLGSEMFFTTTAENAPSQKENVAALWHVGTDGVLEEVASFPKDFWHPTLFQFGTIHFPFAASLRNELYFQLVGVVGDNHNYRLRAKP
jgi:hypothetical protein